MSKHKHGGEAMKRSMALFLAAALLALLLTGCGELRTDKPDATATPGPEITVIPESMMPKPEDGVVTDGNGVIGDENRVSGAVGTPGSTSAAAGAKSAKR